MSTDDFWGEPISTYTNAQAVADGMKAHIFENRWPQLSGGKPITATSDILAAFSLAACVEIWNDYVAWRRKADPNREWFSTTMNNQTIWLEEDAECFTILFPSEH